MAELTAKTAAGAQGAESRENEQGTGFANMIYRGLRMASDRNRSYRRTVEELRRLDARQLRDIGVTPHDIENIAARLATRAGAR